MTFIHKIRKAFHWRTYVGPGLSRALADLPGFLRGRRERIHKKRMQERSLSLTIPNILKGIDPGALARLQELKAEEGRKPEEGGKEIFWTKYLEVEKWLKLNIRYAHELGLVEKPPRSVLDLGCGGGFFLTVCRHLGSKVMGMDLDKDLVLNDMIALFGLKRVVWRIRAFVKLPDLRRKFDLITAFMICFNFPPRGGYWGVREWDFFLNDVAGHLLPGGRLLLSLNRQPDGECYDETLKGYFESRGGEVDGKRILFSEAGLRRDYPPVPPAPSPAPRTTAAPATVAEV